MKVKVKFLTPMIKNGKLREIGEELEIDATSALLLAKKGNVEIQNYKIVKTTKEVEVEELEEIK
jgi:hypothetical protein